MSIQRLITLPSGMPEHFHHLENRDPKAWYCGADPAGKKVGSGGGSAHLLWSAYRDSGFKGSMKEWLEENQHMVIHSGGESR